MDDNEIDLGKPKKLQQKKKKTKLKKVEEATSSKKLHTQQKSKLSLSGNIVNKDNLQRGGRQKGSKNKIIKEKKKRVSKYKRDITDVAVNRRLKYAVEHSKTKDEEDTYKLMIKALNDKSINSFALDKILLDVKQNKNDEKFMRNTRVSLLNIYKKTIMTEFKNMVYAYHSIGVPGFNALFVAKFTILANDKRNLLTKEMIDTINELFINYLKKDIEINNLVDDINEMFNTYVKDNTEIEIELAELTKEILLSIGF